MAIDLFVHYNSGGMFSAKPIATLWHEDDGKMRLCLGDETGIEVTYADLQKLHEGLGYVLLQRIQALEHPTHPEDGRFERGC